MKKVVLKSAHPEQYGDLVIECRELTREELSEYIAKTPESEKFVGTKVAPVEARKGVVGEEITTTLTVVVEGREYIMSEETNVVKEREQEDGTMQPDIVVTNVNSTSNERYIVKFAKFMTSYTPNADGTFTPVPEERQLTRVSENIIFPTSWGAPALCLAGSYIVTYNAAGHDYNTIEKGAFESTYAVVPKEPSKKLQ